MIPVALVHVCGGAVDDDHPAPPHAVVEDTRVAVFGRTGDVDGDVFAEGFGVEGLEERLVHEFWGVEGGVVRVALWGCGGGAGVDFRCGGREEGRVAQGVPE